MEALGQKRLCISCQRVGCKTMVLAQYHPIVMTNTFSFDFWLPYHTQDLLVLHSRWMHYSMHAHTSSRGAFSEHAVYYFEVPKRVLTVPTQPNVSTAQG
jgi:hypothetical protein